MRHEAGSRRTFRNVIVSNSYPALRMRPGNPLQIYDANNPSHWRPSTSQFDYIQSHRADVAAARRAPPIQLSLALRPVCPVTSGYRSSIRDLIQRTPMARSSFRAARIQPKRNTCACRTTPVPSCWCSCSRRNGIWSCPNCSSPCRVERRISSCSRNSRRRFARVC